ncbi:MAG: endonuclease dU [Candidatus Syntropharchaeia archaeon]
MALNKRGIRVLGVAESFERDRPKSVLAGIVMRGDLQIDGIALGEITVGGTDSTNGIINLFRKLGRKDINALFLNGCVISWFNIVRLDELFDVVKIPVLCVTYEESKGLEDHIKRHFDDWKERVEAYKRLGERIPIELHTGYTIFVRFLGITERDAEYLLNRFTTHGKVPEPLRTARILARSVLRR